MSTYAHTYLVSFWNPKCSQSGIAVLSILLFVGLSAITSFFVFLNSQHIHSARNQKTADSLATAKMALMASATSVDLSGNARPGDLPCPDLNNDGIAEPACSNVNGRALGRLPWRTLGLEDLRDGYGERLWYAVSANFKNNPRTACVAPNDVGCLNSESFGTITVRRPTGTILLNGEANSGAVAVVFSPGAPLTRGGGSDVQNRSCELGVNCDASSLCTTNPASLTPLCNPANYLDIANGEDNADFIDTTANGFSQGPVMDNLGSVILNDRLVTIEYAEILPLMERRVAKEVEACLVDYPSQSLTGNTRYPYAAAVIPGNVSPNYSDASAALFGRIPDTPFNQTVNDGIYNLNLGPLGVIPIQTMSNTWSGKCNIVSDDGWWLNWKEQIFYGVADAFKPAPNYVGFSLNTASCPNCLTINNTLAPQLNKRFVVIVAGNSLDGQIRINNSDKNSVSNYLEGENSDADELYLQQSSTDVFNDVLYYQ